MNTDARDRYLTALLALADYYVDIADDQQIAAALAAEDVLSGVNRGRN